MSLSRRNLKSEPVYRSWKPVTAGQMAGVSVGFCVSFYLLKTDDDGFLFVVDHANLVFHEAGHVIFGILGGTPGLYGGTLGQLAIPLIVGAAFAAQREPVGFAIAGVWFFQNFLNIARYMADARAQLLPLVGGGDHDWTNIFTRWGSALLGHGDRSCCRGGWLDWNGGCLGVARVALDLCLAGKPCLILR